MSVFEIKSDISSKCTFLLFVAGRKGKCYARTECCINVKTFPWSFVRWTYTEMTSIFDAQLKLQTFCSFMDLPYKATYMYQSMIIYIISQLYFIHEMIKRNANSCDHCRKPRLHKLFNSLFYVWSLFSELEDLVSH